MGFLLAFLGAVCFSLSNVIMKKGMRTEQKDNGVFLTMVVNVCWMGLAWLVSLWIQGGARAEGKGIVLFILAGLLTTLLGRYALFAGIRSVGPSRAVAVKNAAPLFTLLFAVFVLRESIAAGPWAGIALTFIGLLMAGVCFFREEGKAGTFAGYLFALIAAMGFGFGQAVQKQGLLYYGDPFAGAFIGSAAALVAFFAMEAWKKKAAAVVKANFFSANRYYFFGGTMLSVAILCFFSSLTYIHVAYAGSIIAAEPVLTVILSRIFLKNEEELSPLMIGSAIVVFAGTGIIALTG